MSCSYINYKVMGVLKVILLLSYLPALADFRMKTQITLCIFYDSDEVNEDSNPLLVDLETRNSRLKSRTIAWFNKVM